MSYRLFNLTNTLKDAAVPHSNNTLLLRNTLLLGTVGFSLYFVCFGLMKLFVYS